MNLIHSKLRSWHANIVGVPASLPKERETLYGKETKRQQKSSFKVR